MGQFKLLARGEIARLHTAALTNWVAEMSAFLKQIDPNHLVGIGDEGFLRRAGSPDWTYDGSQGADFEAEG